MLIGGILILSAAISAAACALSGAFASAWWLLWLPLGFLGSFLVLGGLAFALLWLACRLVDFSVPQEHDSKFYRDLLRLYIPAVMTILQMRIHAKGIENIPKDGRFFLVCNHINDLDPVTLLGMFPKSQLAFITKRENMSMFLVGKLMHKILCQPINRENDKEALKTILNCIQLIKQDMVSIAVFPEGYTSMDGKLHKFRHGVFKIAQKTKVPVVVCTLQNTNKVFHNALRLKPTDVHVHLVKVLQPEFFENMTAVELGEYVHELMAEDLGPDLVLSYEENA